MALFIGSTGGIAAHKTLLQSYTDDGFLTQWHQSLLPYLSQLRKLLYPFPNYAIIVSKIELLKKNS